MNRVTFPSLSNAVDFTDHKTDKRLQKNFLTAINSVQLDRNGSLGSVNKPPAKGSLSKMLNCCQLPGCCFVSYFSHLDFSITKSDLAVVSQ